MKTRCPACDSAIIVEAHETVYDEQRYAAQCPSCNAHLIAEATVDVTYDLEVAHVDDEGVAIEYCDESVNVRTDHTTNRERMRAALDLLIAHGAQIDPKWIKDYQARFGSLKGDEK